MSFYANRKISLSVLTSICMLFLMGTSFASSTHHKKISTSKKILKASKGSLVILSVPSNAELVFNSEKKGFTPALVKLTKPSNRIVLRLKGYKTYDAMIEKNTLTRQLKVTLKREGTEGSSTTEEKTVVSEPEDSISFSSTPSDSDENAEQNASQDSNTEAITSPASNQTSKSVSKPIEKPIEKPTVKPLPDWNETAVRVPEGQPQPKPQTKPTSSKTNAAQTATTSETTDMGMVFISSSPSQAEITLDGIATGKKTPARFDLSAGVHHFEMQRDGLKGSMDYEIKAGKNKALLMQLQ